MSEEFSNNRQAQPVPSIISSLPGGRLNSVNGVVPVGSTTLADFRKVAENLPEELLEQAFKVLTEIRRKR